MKNITTQQAIIIASIILGIAFFGVQYNKSVSIERQQTQKIQEERRKEIAESVQKNLQEQKLKDCLAAAETDYWDYMKLNGTEREDGTIWADTYQWDRAAKTKAANQEVCYKVVK